MVVCRTTHGTPIIMLQRRPQFNMLLAETDSKKRALCFHCVQRATRQMTKVQTFIGIKRINYHSPLRPETKAETVLKEIRKYLYVVT